MSRLAIKRVFLLFIQNLAASIFIGISVYGAINYWGGEAERKISVAVSLLLGLGAVVCVVIVVAIGGHQDKMAGSSENRSAPERSLND